MGRPTQDWLFETVGEVNGPASLISVNDDGLLEVIVGCGNRNLYCLSHDGAKIRNYTTRESILVDRKQGTNGPATSELVSIQSREIQAALIDTQ